MSINRLLLAYLQLLCAWLKICWASHNSTCKGSNAAQDCPRRATAKHCFYEGLRSEAHAAAGRGIFHLCQGMVQAKRIPCCVHLHRKTHQPRLCNSLFRQFILRRLACKTGAPNLKSMPSQRKSTFCPTWRFVEVPMLMGFSSASFSSGASSCSTATSLSGSPPMTCTSDAGFLQSLPTLPKQLHCKLRRHDVDCTHGLQDCANDRRCCCGCIESQINCQHCRQVMIDIHGRRELF